MSQKNDVDAAVLRATVFGGVAGDGVKLGVACGGEIGGVDGAVFEKQPGDGGGARGGELPVAGELRGVDGHVVGVAFDAERAGGQGGGEDRRAWGCDAARTSAEPEGKKPASWSEMTRPSGVMRMVMPPGGMRPAATCWARSLVRRALVSSSVSVLVVGSGGVRAAGGALVIAAALCR